MVVEQRIDCDTNVVMERDAVLNIRLPAEVKAALRLAAEDDHGRSLSGMVVRVLREWLGAAGYLTAEGEPAPRPKKKRR